MLEDIVHIGNGQDFIFDHMPGHFGNAFLAVRNEGRLKGDAQRPAEQGRYGIPVCQAADEGCPGQMGQQPADKKVLEGVGQKQDDCRRNQDIIGNLAASAPIYITRYNSCLLPIDDDIVAIMLGNPQGYVGIGLFEGR